MAISGLCTGQCPAAQNRCQALLAFRPVPAAAGARVGVWLDHGRLPWLGGGEVHRLGGAGAGVSGISGDCAAHQAAAVETHGHRARSDLRCRVPGRHGAVGRRAMARGRDQAVLRQTHVPQLHMAAPAVPVRRAELYRHASVRRPAAGLLAYPRSSCSGTGSCVRTRLAAHGRRHQNRHRCGRGRGPVAGGVDQLPAPWGHDWRGVRHRSRGGGGSGRGIP